ncbi:Xaa-Pro aminopeptidase [Catalinimonas alkaloidigena]|uniref:aminopeptidase P family protein n=1 Tax=Catalinimonas alkaloidigena TaxID=1075417 RepID=UPI002405B41D|nr:aminopeptidase P family protein [Catalinimonas alkaloidigena]MDF9797152.1 Xaa-Pro aminopeptidase [Catalinimonas alkaloidigena]
MNSLKRFDMLTYQKRRQKLSEQFQDGLVLLFGNGESSMNFSDNWYPFRQDSTFLYYTGIDTPDLVMLIDLDGEKEILFGDDVSMDQIIWTGPLPTVAERAKMAGIKHSSSTKDLKVFLQKAQDKSRNIRFLPPYREERIHKLHHLLDIPISSINQKVAQDLIRAVIAQRSYKSNEEVNEMEKAINISNQMHLLAIQSAKAGMREYELVGKVKGKAIACGGDVAYPVILTINGQTLHNHYYGNSLKDGNMVLMDAGAENTMHYAADLTRTFPVSNKFSSLQKDMYNIVLDAYEHAVKSLIPGKPFRDIHLLAAEKLVSGLVALGFMKGKSKEAVEAGAHTMFFQCGLGHMIGLDVHDMEDLGEEYVGYDESVKKSSVFGLKSLRLGKALEIGQTITVEPGIYIIPELIDRWQAEMKYIDFINYEKLNSIRDFGGIRIEDNFLITKEGSRKLGDYLPLKAEEIEDLRS